MQEQGELFVHGTCRKFAEKILQESTLRSGFNEIWAAVASEQGREIAAFFAQETAEREQDVPVLVYFRTEAIPDELRYMGETVAFFEWEYCWRESAMEVNLVATVSCADNQSLHYA